MTTELKNPQELSDEMIYKPQDKVWFMKDNNVCTGYIIECIVKHKHINICGEWKLYRPHIIIYLIKDHDIWVEEYRLFPSQEKLIEKLTR